MNNNSYGISMTQEKTSNKTSLRLSSKKNYNKMSKWYDIFSSFENRYRKAGLEKFNIDQEENILEIGFGTGQSLIKMAKEIGDNGSIHGIDISEGMISKTQKRLKKSKIKKNIHLICGDATILPYKKEVFNGIFICFTIELFDFDDILLILKEAKRVIQKEGRICIVTISNRRKNLMTRIYDWFHRKMPRIIDCRPIEVKKFIDEVSLEVADEKEMTMWGLPVDIIIALKK
ncbi:MAG: methyltransferase domain-containing protein [Asgard group archaeon]|nr:methyltransferase domain-containing protein [Asgard group archaeon]